MKGLYLVEPVLALYSFAGFLIYPLIQQYVYRRLWQQLTNTTYPVSDNSSRCADPVSHNNSDFHHIVQEQASLFSVYMEVVSAIPSLLVTLLLLAYSDRGGRKITIILPVLGNLIYVIALLFVSYFELNLYLLIGASLISSCFGGMGTLFGGCFAYVADLCKDGPQKTLRMAGLDMVIGLLSGGAALSTGYFLRAAGFNWPFLTSAICFFIVLLYAVFILEETVTKPQADAFALDGSPRRCAVIDIFFRAYRLFTGASRKCKAVFVLLMSTFVSYTFIYFGGTSRTTLFELNPPLCWSEILIGYGAALSTTAFLGSFAGVWLFTLCRVPQLLIVAFGVMSVMAGLIMTAFADTTLKMFLVRVPMLLTIMPLAVLRSMMSKIVSKSDQGILFACTSFFENLTVNISTVIFSSIYASTVAWYPGFSFLLAAGLCVVPFGTLAVIAVLGTDVAMEPATLIRSEEDLAQEHDQNNGLIK